jgi:hypothetical protein
MEPARIAVSLVRAETLPVVTGTNALVATLIPTATAPTTTTPAATSHWASCESSLMSETAIASTAQVMTAGAANRKLRHDIGGLRE